MRKISKLSNMLLFLSIPILLILSCQLNQEIPINESRYNDSNESQNNNSKIDYTQKIHVRLINHLNSSDNSNLPYFLINQDGTWNIIVMCKKKVDDRSCLKIITKYGTINRQADYHIFEVKIQKEKIYNLAKENEIRWIEEGLPPYIEENFDE